MKGRKSFNLSPLIFRSSSTIFFILLIMISPYFIPLFFHSTLSIDNQLVRYTFKTDPKGYILAFFKGETKDFLLSLFSDRSFLFLSPPLPPPFFKCLSIESPVKTEFSSTLDRCFIPPSSRENAITSRFSQEKKKKKEKRYQECAWKGQGGEKTAIKSRVMNGEMIDDWRIPETETLGRSR